MTAEPFNRQLEVDHRVEGVAGKQLWGKKDTQLVAAQQNVAKVAHPTWYDEDGTRV